MNPFLSLAWVLLYKCGRTRRTSKEPNRWRVGAGTGYSIQVFLEIRCIDQVSSREVASVCLVYHFLHSISSASFHQGVGAFGLESFWQGAAFFPPSPFRGEVVTWWWAKQCLTRCLKGPIFRVSFSFTQRPKKAAVIATGFYHGPWVSSSLKLLRTPVWCGRGPCLPTSFWNWMRSGLPELNDAIKIMVSICKTLKDQCLYYILVSCGGSILFFLVSMVLCSYFFYLLLLFFVVTYQLSQTLEKNLRPGSFHMHSSYNTVRGWTPHDGMQAAFGELQDEGPLKSWTGSVFEPHEVSLLARSYIEVYCFNCLLVVSNICLESGEDVHVHYIASFFGGVSNIVQPTVRSSVSARFKRSCLSFRWRCPGRR